MEISQPRRATVVLPQAEKSDLAERDVSKFVRYELSEPSDSKDADASEENWFKTVVEGRSFETDLETARPAEKDSLYLSWADKLLHSLGAAYPLYLHLLNDPKNVEKVLADNYFTVPDSNKRKPGTKNLALVALKFVTRPATEEDNKSCSAYSTMLKLAESRKVNPENFAEAMKSVTLRDARKAFRKTLPKAAEKKIRIEFFTGESPIKREILLPESLTVDEEFCQQLVTDIISRLPAGSRP